MLLLQITVSLLVGVQGNPRATVEQKNLALSFATQAIAISQVYLSANVTGQATATPPAAPAPVSLAPAATSPAPVAPATPAQNASTGSSILVTPLGATSNRVKSAVDDVATLTLSPSGAGGISLTTLRITIYGNLASSSFGNVDVKLVNTSNVPVGTLAAVSCNSGNTCVFAWSGFGSAGIVASGSSLVLKLRIDSQTNTLTAGAGVSSVLGVAIQSAGDLTYNDTVDGSGVTVGLPANAVPLLLSSVSYVSGM